MAPVRVKICGVRNEADAVLAAGAGADAVGLNFYPPSPRSISVDVARGVLRALPPLVEPVALYVDRPLREVIQALNVLGGVRTFQWHGAARELCDTSPFRMVVAFPLRDRQTLRDMSRYLETACGLGRGPAAVLVDAHVPGMHGGTGHRAPWELLAEYRPPVPLILAGGLTPDNVAEAIRAVRPYAVDVASGVESAPGVKDPDKVRRFLDNARAAAG